MAERSLLEKLVTHFESVMATIVDSTAFDSRRSGQLTPQSAARMADQVLGIVRLHDEQRAAQREPGCDCMADAEPAPVADDPEIALMAHTLAVLRTLDADTVQRYRQWVDERFVRTHPF